MPNHCSNTLTVKGSKKDITKFKEENFTDEKLDFNGIKPMPEELKEAIQLFKEDKKTQKERMEKYGAKDWYDWAIKNWGTKWNAYDQTEIEDNGNKEFSISFTTAWGPAKEWFYAIAEKYQTITLKLEYEEPGMVFAGIYTAKHGIIEHEQFEPTTCEECGCEYFGDECTDEDHIKESTTN